MANTAKGKVCVTGASGFIASWLVKRLLESGYHVLGTVRDPGLLHLVLMIWMYIELYLSNEPLLKVQSLVWWLDRESEESRTSLGFGRCKGKAGACESWPLGRRELWWCCDGLWGCLPHCVSNHHQIWLQGMLNTSSDHLLEIEYFPWLGSAQNSFYCNPDFEAIEVG